MTNPRKAKIRVLEAEPPGTDTVAKLEEALERAKKGELSSVAFAVVYRDGTCGHGWSKAPSLSCLIGAVARLQYSLTAWAEE
jgi:hypothetical protein